MATYNNLDSLYKALGVMVEKSLNKTADKIVEQAKQIIWDEFYKLYTPKEGGYERTWQLLNGCVRSRIIKKSNTYSVEIYMDDSTATQGYDDNEIYDVWLLASVGFHGNLGVQTDGKYWVELKKYVFDNWKQLLIKNGLNVS